MVEDVSLCRVDLSVTVVVLSTTVVVVEVPASISFSYSVVVVVVSFPLPEELSTDGLFALSTNVPGLVVSMAFSAVFSAEELLAAEFAEAVLEAAVSVADAAPVA